MDVSNSQGNRPSYTLDILISKFIYFFYFPADYFYAIIQIMSLFAAGNVIILLTDSLLSLPVLRTLLYEGEEWGAAEKNQLLFWSGPTSSFIQGFFDWS